MRKFLILLILCAVLAVVAEPASAQWRRAGLFGADVRALIVDPNNADRLFLGTSGGEVYVSTDGAKSWTSPRSTPFPGYIVDNLLLDRAGRLWAASWGLWGGGVIAVSDDGGRSWERRDSGLEDFSVRAIAIDPNDEDFILAGGLSGVHRSHDGGKSWEKLSEHINVESLAIDPRTRDRIYVGTWRQGWRTDDGGKSWSHIANGMVLDTDMFAITIEADNPDSVWVSTCGWVYNTGNRGDLWTRYRDGFNNRRIHDIDVDPCNKDVVYAGSVAGLYRTEDRGKSWYVVGDEELVINSVVLHPQRPERIILGIEGDGVYVSHDRGRTFARTSDGLRNLRITSIVPDPAQRDRVYASVVFGGAASGIYGSEDGGRSWKKVSTTRLPEVLSFAAADEPNPEVRFVAGTEKGFFFSNDAVEWTQATPSDFPIRVEKVLRFNRTRYFAATKEGVFTSRDSGRSWYRLAGADVRAVDIAIGRIGAERALFALTSGGLLLFDGTKWSPIEGAPAKGRTLAIRNLDGSQFLFVAGMNGVRAGRVDVDRRWHSADAPDAQYAAVYGGSRTTDDNLLFLTSRQQREILIADPNAPEWVTLSLPAHNADITTVVPDLFVKDRFYVGTLGEGVFIYEGKTDKYVAKPKPETGSAASLGAGASR